MKIGYYKLVKIIIDALGLAKVIINVIVRYHNFSNSIIINRDLLFASKFLLLQCYFFNIK